MDSFQRLGLLLQLLLVLINVQLNFRGALASVSFGIIENSDDDDDDGGGDNQQYTSRTYPYDLCKGNHDEPPPITEIHLRAAAIHRPPFSTILEDETDTDRVINITGFNVDLARELEVIALRDDNITLNISIQRSLHPGRSGSIDLIANDCNTTANINTKEDCDYFDMMLGMQLSPSRAQRVNLLPAYLRTSITTVKTTNKKPTADSRKTRDYTLVRDTIQDQVPVCATSGTIISKVVKEQIPEANWTSCGPSSDECLQDLLEGRCFLYASDENQLRSKMVDNLDLEVTGEQFGPRRFIGWGMSYQVDPRIHALLMKWTYSAVATGKVDEFYYKYFQVKTCPVGFSGTNCTLPCHPFHGKSNKFGVCVCVSNRWTGDDCSEEVLQDRNEIPSSLVAAGYTMFGINTIACLVCATWLWTYRNSAVHVRMAQSYFLVLVLLGCTVSTSAIVAMVQQGDDASCMAVPWLYSIGFCITFGTLFAKIRRVQIVFQSAIEMRRVVVSAMETVIIITALVLLDAIILTTWTALDPLKWKREITMQDVLGHPLESIGYCYSDHWEKFALCIALLHFALLLIALWYCYLSRDIPPELQEGKSVMVAMVSNAQIFVIGVPVLIIVGSDPGISFFVRSCVIWMNDFVVVTVIFGRLMYMVHFSDIGRGRNGLTNSQTERTIIRNAVQGSSKRSGTSRSGSTSESFKQRIENENHC